MTVIPELHCGKRGTIFFASSFSCTPDFCVFSISKLSAAYAERHYAQRGSGTYSDNPGSFREAGCCLLLSAKWGQFAVSGDARVGV